MGLVLAYMRRQQLARDIVTAGVLQAAGKVFGPQQHEEISPEAFMAELGV